MRRPLSSLPTSARCKRYSGFHIRVVVQWPGANPPAPARRRGQPHHPPSDRVRYRAHCAYLTPSPGSRCGCRAGSTSRRSHGAGAFAPGRWTTARDARSAGQAGVGWRSIGRSPTAIRLKNTGGGHRRGRPCLVGRAMTVTDHAAAVFFRAVARDRHPTPGCTASRTLRGYEKCFSQHAKNLLTGSRLTASRAVSS